VGGVGESLESGALRRREISTLTVLKSLIPSMLTDDLRLRLQHKYSTAPLVYPSSLERSLIEAAARGNEVVVCKRMIS
jgi:hypothetical protein